MSQSNLPELPAHLRLHRSLRSALGIIAVLLVIVLSLALAKGPTLGSTEASWSDAATSSGQFEAGTVPAPQLTQECRYVSNLSGANIVIYWSAPDLYDVTDAELRVSSSGLGSVLVPLDNFDLQESTVGTTAAYTTTIPVGLLGSLITVGSEINAAIFMSRGDWLSEPATVRANLGIAGIGAGCENLP